MDISVYIETKNIPLSARNNRIFRKFRENRLLPLIEIIHSIDNNNEIIDILMLASEMHGNGKYYLIARQIEIIRQPQSKREFEPELFAPFQLNL